MNTQIGNSAQGVNGLNAAGSAAQQASANLASKFDRAISQSERPPQQQTQTSVDLPPPALAGTPETAGPQSFVVTENAYNEWDNTEDNNWRNENITGNYNGVYIYSAPEGEVNGTKDNDYIRTYNYNAIINGDAGNDYIQTSGRNGAQITAGDGNDLVKTGAGGGANITAGYGNDAVILQTMPPSGENLNHIGGNTNIETGHGDDLVELARYAGLNYPAINVFGNVTADGGPGNDTFRIPIDIQYLTVTSLVDLNGNNVTQIVSSDPNNPGTFTLTGFETIQALSMVNGQPMIAQLSAPPGPAPSLDSPL